MTLVRTAKKKKDVIQRRVQLKTSKKDESVTRKSGSGGVALSNSQAQEGDDRDEGVHVVVSGLDSVERVCWMMLCGKGSSKVTKN
jgi:hypothetical protein